MEKPTSYRILEALKAVLSYSQHMGLRLRQTHTPDQYALSATVFGTKVVNIYLVQYLGHPANLWYSAAPLELIDSGYGPDLVLLTMPLDESVRSSDCCKVCQKNGKLVFRAGAQEQCIDKLPNI